MCKLHDAAKETALSAFKFLGVRDWFAGAVVASLGLVTSLVVTLKMEVTMITSIATNVQLSFLTICLVAGAGCLGSQASPQSEES